MIVLNKQLAAGAAANAAAVLSMSLGAQYPELIGPDVADADGGQHRGITQVPIPVLAAELSRLSELAQAGDEEVAVFGFTDTAARSRTYADYETSLAELSGGSLEYFGVALSGPKKKLRALTGALPLFR